MRSLAKRLLRDACWELVALARGRRRERLAGLAEGGEILFVCLGNICRSPMAEVLACSVAAERRLGFRFRSAGIKVESSRPATPEAVAAAAELGHDLGAHISRPLTAEMMAAAGLVVAMEAWQARALKTRYPAARDKVVLLPDFSPTPGRGRARCNISDPFGHGLEAYRACRNAIRDCLTNLFDHLASRSRDGAILNDTPPEAAAPARQLLYLALPILVAGLIFWPTLQDLWRICAADSDNSHCLLVPLVSMWLLWGKRRELAAPGGSLAGGLILLLAGLLLYLAGIVGFVQFLASLGVVASISGLAWLNLGWRSFKPAAFAFAFLIFAIPVPLSVTKLVAFPLQLFATRASAAILGLLAIPVLREGNMLYFAHTQLEVAEACSGIRSLTAFLMLGTLFAYLTRRCILRRLSFLGLAIPLALVMNVVRVTGTGLLAYLCGDRIARGFLHEFSGLLVFAVGFAVMAAVHLLLEREAPRAA